MAFFFVQVVFLGSMLHGGKMAARPLSIKLYSWTEKKKKKQEYFVNLRSIIYLPEVYYLSTLQATTPNGNNGRDAGQCFPRAWNRLYPLPVFFSVSV